TRVAPLGDPIVLRLRNYSLSIRRAEAAGIEVDEPQS
ncbi:MAG: FeoA domain-containing protein, partial [Acidobacteriota bacterium]|nr:FeoA domain-containing protein [Acidobacteriota bacterium]